MGTDSAAGQGQAEGAHSLLLGHKGRGYRSGGDWGGREGLWDAGKAPLLSLMWVFRTCSLWKRIPLCIYDTGSFLEEYFTSKEGFLFFFLSSSSSYIETTITKTVRCHVALGHPPFSWPLCKQVGWSLP